MALWSYGKHCHAQLNTLTLKTNPPTHGSTSYTIVTNVTDTHTNNRHKLNTPTGKEFPARTQMCMTFRRPYLVAFEIFSIASQPNKHWHVRTQKSQRKTHHPQSYQSISAISQPVPCQSPPVSHSISWMDLSLKIVFRTLSVPPPFNGNCVTPLYAPTFVMFQC